MINSHSTLLPLSQISSKSKLSIPKMDSDEASTMHSRVSQPKSVSGYDNSPSHTQVESSDDEIDILRKHMDHQKAVSLPTSMKEVPSIGSRYWSRQSQRINRADEVLLNTMLPVIDSNGDKLMSNLKSTQDLFQSLSTNKSSRRSSMMHSNRSNNMMNAANQVVFGNVQKLREMHNQRSHSNLYRKDVSPTGKKSDLIETFVNADKGFLYFEI